MNNHNEENDSSSEDILDNNHKINNVKNLKKKYYIGNVIGDGNCLFYSLSKLIFRNMFYYSHIRQLICDKIENTNIYDEFIEDKSEYVKKRRNDKEYGSLLEIETFCEIFKIKIIVYTRKIIDENYLKKDTDLLDTYIVGEKYKGNFGLIFDKYAKDETGIYNHYSDLYPKDNNIGISDQELQNIRNEIINKCPNTKIDSVISGRTGKKVGSRQGKSDWNLYDILSRKNKEKNTFNYYIVVTRKMKLKMEILQIIQI